AICYDAVDLRYRHPVAPASVRSLANRPERQLGARLLNGFGGFIERRAVYRHKQRDWLPAFSKQGLRFARNNPAKLAGFTLKFIRGERFHIRTIASLAPDVIARGFRVVSQFVG